MSERLKHHDQLSVLIEEKRGRLPEGAAVLGPDEVDPPTAAGVMMEILSAVYGKHNLLPTTEQLANQIKSGKVLPWFIEEKNRFVACAALIVNEAYIEIGRAANHPEFGHNGSLLMLEAVVFYRKNHQLPLVAEIRLADHFEGIIGGQASQVTLLKHVGMKPSAIVPAFHHPGPHGPDRQEFFCFCVDPRPRQPNHFFMPKALWKDPLIQSLKNSIFPLTEVVLVDQEELPDIRFQIDPTPPFNILQAGPNGVSFEEAMAKTQKPFTLAIVPLDAERSSVAEFLTRKGFVLCGFAWQNPALLMGRLKPEVILAPVGLATGCFKEETERAILEVEEKFKSQIKHRG